MRFDLHAHTTWSDGDRTPAEVAQIAAREGIGVALTDHDECRGFGEIAGKDYGVPVFPGIELAARCAQGSVHVLGLCIDWQDEGLVGHITSATNARLHRAAHILEKLRAGGVNIAMDDLAYQGDIVGRAHIAEAMVSKGYAADIKDAFARFLSNRAPYYVPYEKISVADAARLITRAGGLAIIAHPGLMPPGAFDALLPYLKDMGFWGVEAYHPSHTDGQCREYESLARSRGLFVTAGSDFHGSVKPDIALGHEKRGGAYLRESMEELVLIVGTQTKMPNN